MKTRILVNQVGNKIVDVNNGVVCPKLNNVLAKRKLIIFDNK